MKAPDKIYILHHEDYSDRRILNAFIEKEEDTDIEYIRKDALLECAKERYKAIENGNQLGELFKQGVLYELHRVIAKIESL